MFMLTQRNLWFSNNPLSIILSKITISLHSEFKLLLRSNFINNTLVFTALLLIIAFNNLLGLFPYIFTSSRHLVVALALAAPLWISFIIYGWINNTKHIFAHLTPLSTPSLLMPFIVLIESISNLIRPGTLTVRLSANMIAGHLLMTLLGTQTSFSAYLILYLLLLSQISLLVLESAVALIQAYVFTILSTLYSSETTSL